MGDYRYFFNGVTLVPTQNWYMVGNVVTVQWNVINPMATAEERCYIAVRPLALGSTDDAILTGELLIWHSLVQARLTYPMQIAIIRVPKTLPPHAHVGPIPSQYRQRS